MPFGEFWPDHQADAAIHCVADHNWRLLQDIGGGMVGTVRRSIDEHQRLAAEARQRGDHDAQRRHDEEVDRLFDQLETYLSYVGGAQ